MSMMFNGRFVCDTKMAWTIDSMFEILKDIKKYGSKSLSYKYGWSLRK